jgi:hypothetical protein
MKKVRRLVFMKNPIEGKPEKLNEYQGLGILALEDVNKWGGELFEVRSGQKMTDTGLTNDFDTKTS